MTAGELIRMEAQIAVLKEIELEYPGNPSATSYGRWKDG